MEADPISGSMIMQVIDGEALHSPKKAAPRHPDKPPANKSKSKSKSKSKPKSKSRAGRRKSRAQS